MIADTTDLMGLVAQQSIYWETTVPLIDIRPIAANLAPEGKWIRADRVVSMLKLAINRLHRMRSYAMGATCVVFSRDLKRLALVPVPSRQRKLNMYPSSKSTESNKDGDVEGVSANTERAFDESAVVEASC